VLAAEHDVAPLDAVRVLQEWQVEADDLGVREARSDAFREVGILARRLPAGGNQSVGKVCVTS